MENQKLGQEPAFACTYEMKIFGQNKLCYHEGMSKRFYAACAAMQGLLSNPSIGRPQSFADVDGYEEFIKVCYSYADELLKQENL